MAGSYLNRVVGSFESRSDRIAMRIVGDDSQVYTFGESLRQIRSVAYRIRQEGVNFGDRIVVIGENHPSWAISYLASLYHGAVCVPVDPHGEIETITNFLENSEAKLAFIDTDQRTRFGLIEEKLGRKIPAVVWSARPDATDAAVSNGFQSFAEWASTDFPDSFAQEMPKAAGDDVALLIYTSGTTGTPKGVPLTHGNIVAELDGINEVLKLSDKEKILSLLPLFHAYLQIVNLWVATTYGCEVGYLKELSPAELGNAMKEFKPTILTTVPRLWYLFHKKIFDAVEAKPKAVQSLFRIMLAANGTLRDTIGVNVGKRLFGQVHESFGGELRIAISAGSRFDEDVAIDFHRLGFTILQGYGLTETSGAATATYVDDNRIGSVGKPMFNAKIRIADPDEDGVGEVLIKGEMVFSGYYKNPEATKDAFTDDGWFRSGDLGRIDKDGHLFIVGRAKDVIVLPSGKNVHPEDLEVHYLKAPEVEELAIIGVADESEARAGAEKLIAVVIPDFEYLKQAKIANSKEAVRYALDNLGRELPEYQRVRDYIVRAEPLPRTATRKIKRFALKKEIESGVIVEGLPEKRSWVLSPADAALLESNVARAIVDVVRKNAKDVSVIHPQMNLEIDLGLDSLARAEVFAALEQAFEAEFTADEAASALTLANVIELVGSTPAGKAAAATDTAISADLNWSKILKEADDDFPEVRAVLRKRPIFITFAFVVYRCFNLFCRVFMRLEIEGIENLKKVERPYLICPNHQSFLDPFVLCSNYPLSVFRNIFHVGASMFFKSRFMQFVAKMLNVVPIDQDTQLLRAMKAGAIGLKNGMILNIYPEGERAFDGNLHEFKKGAAILATELELPIVPVALDGLQNVWARRSWKIRPAKVKIRIGQPFYASDVQSTASVDQEDHESKTAISDDARYEFVTEHLKATIERMIQEMRS
ncbi:MAG: AMP-binding protein [Blastocatellia bacterium]|nr:AMP-binding protein [Chloracidobacterium sp.]MBL8183588.1 AMP-binding protein [Blastocatellia bacterium]HRJ87190.1 AMP-binding protein [Pyrinomonadaceae bacterium]HRK49541.1 AMP-binding protein [Pyrinomonadaceae bacterium]